jgi:glycosyl transferase family 25
MTWVDIGAVEGAGGPIPQHGWERAENRADAEPAQTKILVISLQSAIERRAEFRAVSHKIGDWDFFDACTAPVAGMDYDPPAARREFGRELFPAELGCYASHFAIWKQLADDDRYNRYIVLEDDVLVDWDFIKELSHANLDGIGYLRLFYKRACPFRVVRRAFIRRGHNIIQIYGFAFGTQAYVITRAQAIEFLALFARVVRPIDNALDRTWDHGTRNMAVFPFPVIERVTASMIGDARFEGRMSAMNYHRMRDKLRFHLGRLRFAVGAAR